MIKKTYLKPATTVSKIDLHVQILTGSLTNVWTTGLGDENLNRDNSPGNIWNDAMSRHRNNLWDDDEEW